MTPPPSTAVPPVVALAARMITFICLLVSAVVMVTNKIDAESIKFSDFYVYRYMLAAAVIGIAYTLLQAALTLLHVLTGNKIGGDGLRTVDFFGDKVVSYLLATGAAACFGFTVDLKRLNDASENVAGIIGNTDTDKFLNKANAAAAVLFVGFIFSALSSIISSLSLPKRF
ncbi:CASP-like protein PIMP1 [Primulina huaijiensis]|uniref:CASP-like protein PIMP1 n=1 Tax=Primulina huaijiensis TaxID=1492673 RepID=UPI003CC70331